LLLAVVVEFKVMDKQQMEEEVPHNMVERMVALVVVALVIPRQAEMEVMVKVRDLFLYH
jgi:hypothetical protein